MIAFTFPGQGSQRHGMGAPWKEHPSWELVTEASDAAGRDVAALLLDAPDDELTRTRNAQIATFVLSMVVLDAAERLGADASYFAGHSLGEYSALVAAGAIAFDEGVRLVAERGDAMQAAADETDGTMAAVLGLDDDAVAAACAEIEGLWVANYNGPGQVVVAGTRDGIARAEAAMKAAGAKRVMALPVGGAFHSPLMAPASERLAKALRTADIRPTAQPVVANVDAAAHAGVHDWAGALERQLVSPVRWRQSLHTLADLGAATIIELGPGTVLTGLAKRTLPGARTLAVNEPAHLDAMLEALAAPSGGPVGLPPHEGEHLFATERLVISPAAGVFAPAPSLVPGEPVAVGTEVGTVNGQPVRSPFEGIIVGVVALAGERLTSSQPVAWLRTA